VTVRRIMARGTTARGMMVRRVTVRGVIVRGTMARRAMTMSIVYILLFTFLESIDSHSYNPLP
jgi:hypothetical protein